MYINNNILKQREIDDAEVKALEDRIEKYHQVYNQFDYWPRSE